jgi:hypothetical protein
LSKLSHHGKIKRKHHAPRQREAENSTLTQEAAAKGKEHGRECEILIGMIIASQKSLHFTRVVEAHTSRRPHRRIRASACSSLVWEHVKRQQTRGKIAKQEHLMLMGLTKIASI